MGWDGLVAIYGTIITQSMMAPYKASCVLLNEKYFYGFVTNNLEPNWFQNQNVFFLVSTFLNVAFVHTYTYMYMEL